jgi:D-methionine transport system substrate-binding protein
MKKWLFVVLAVVLVVALSACGAKNSNDNAQNASDNGAGSETTAPAEESGAAAEPVTLKVGATAVPHAEILKVVQPKLAEEGINLEIVEFTDYVQPNVQVYEKQLDANFFQHIPYLEQFNKDQNMDLVNAGGVHIEPFGAYSQKIKSVDELKDGAKVAIPNDPSNGGRALALLENNGLIKLTEGKGVNATVADIVENPKNLQIQELEAAMLPRVLADVDMALINTNYALEAGFVPTEDALFIEGSDSPYVNIIAARPDNKDSDEIQKLIQALQSQEVKDFINSQYKGAVVPAF